MSEPSRAVPSDGRRTWMEVIRLRTPADNAEERARVVQQALNAIPSDTRDRRVQVFVHAMVRSDLLVLVEHTTPDGQGLESALGHSLEEALREYGSVARSLWISLRASGSSR